MPLVLCELKVGRWSVILHLASLHAEPNKDDALSMFTGALISDLGKRRLLVGRIVVDLLARLQRKAEM